eukprot:m.10781 g.10781  ORF g.10781 m.10781 type:complete len:385 (-) comp8479_c0_seq1:210-1364(-)
MMRVQCCVVGAGAVGLAIAREFARRGRETLVVEAASLIGSGTSSRNSEVVHAGIYYAQTSLKARMCVDGKHQLYEYAESRGIPYQRCGKLIVATDSSQESVLVQIQQKAAQNGVHDLRLLSAAEAHDLEPNVRCTAALYSPSTGIVDSHAFMLAMQGDIENEGSFIAFKSPVTGATRDGDDIVVSIGGDSPMTLACDTFVNCAGLTASKLGASIQVGLPPPPPTHFAKGSYYSLHGSSPFSRLVYPVPEQGTAGLGVHATIDLGGQTRFGPDVEWLSEEDSESIRDSIAAEAIYDVDPKRADVFYSAVRRYWPELQDGQLVPDYSGIRPKLCRAGEGAKDFRIDTNLIDGTERGAAISLYGIESPGLTSALALSSHVAQLLRMQ